MKIEVKSSPRYKGAPIHDCVNTLIVNGYILGTYYGGKEKKYENPEKWARQMIPKRLKVVQRNIQRLTKELKSFQDELQALSPTKTDKQ